MTKWSASYKGVEVIQKFHEEKINGWGGGEGREG